MSNLFKELYKQNRLAARRHPMYKQNLIGKVLGYAMGAIWAAYLLYIGNILAKFCKTAPESFTNTATLVIIFTLVFDFIVRCPLQKTPTQDLKPYLRLPVKRKKLIDFLLIRSGLDLYNLFWLCLFIPIAILFIAPTFSIGKAISFLIGIYLSMIANNYWYLLCRTLINERTGWVLLPICMYAAIGTYSLFCAAQNYPNLITLLCNGLIHGTPLCFIGLLALILILFSTARNIVGKVAYQESTQPTDAKIKHISNFKFLERYGNTGNYMQLELKLLFRNRNCKALLRSSLFIIAMAALLLYFHSFNSSYIIMLTFCFIIFGQNFLMRLMGFEGNYIDGLMVRPGSLLYLLYAKYFIYSIAALIPFALLIPTTLKGNFTWLELCAWYFFTIGIIYFCFFFFSIYNIQTLPLNSKVTARNPNQPQVLTLIVSFIPLLLFYLLKRLGNEQTYLWVLLAGISFTLTAPWWIRYTYRRFMSNRHLYIEKYRDTRE